MNILVIGYVWPEPNSSAAGSRMMQLLSSFRRQNWRITFASPAQLSDHMADLSTLNIHSTQIELNSPSFDVFLKELAPDIVMFDRFMMEEQFAWRVEKHCPNALRILNTEDLHSLRQARHQAIKQQREFDLLDMHQDHAVREIAAILRSDLTLMISDVEVALLKQHFNVPAAQLHHLPFMLETPSSEEVQQRLAFNERQHFISIGNFRHAPNWDAVQQLKQHIWPLIRQQLPMAQLHIYGAYPPPKATQLHNEKQGFLVKGWAPDAKLVMQQARLCLAPLRFGAGIKGKLVEAMQMGTPSITTSIGAEAMHDHLPWSGRIAESAQDFANAAVELYGNSEQWHQCQVQGDAILAYKYPREPLETQLIARIQQQIQQRDTLRQHNFYGLMLRHHSMKSTQYMSQWIEAKNQQLGQ